MWVFLLLSHPAQAEHGRWAVYSHLQASQHLSPAQAYEALSHPGVLRSEAVVFQPGDHDTWVMVGMKDFRPDEDAFRLDFSHPPGDLQVWKWRHGVEIEILQGVEGNDKRNFFEFFPGNATGLYFRLPNVVDREVYYLFRFRAENAVNLKVVSGQYLIFSSERELGLLLFGVLVLAVALLSLAGANHWLKSRSVQHGLYVILSVGSLVMLLFAGVGLHWTTLRNPWLGFLAVCVAYLMVSFAYMGLSLDHGNLSSRPHGRILYLKKFSLIVWTLLAFVALFRGHWKIEVIALHHFYVLIIGCLLYSIITRGRAIHGIRTMIHCSMVLLVGVLIFKVHDTEWRPLNDWLDWSANHYLMAWVAVLALFYFQVVKGWQGGVGGPLNRVNESGVLNMGAAPEKPAVEAVKMEKDKLSIVKHELKAPLASIASLVKLHKSNLDTATIKEDLETISRITEHSLSIIEQTLNEQDENAAHSLSPDAPVDLLLLGKELYALCRAQSQSYPNTFRLDIVRNTPKVVSVDPTRFRRIIVNLLSNAFRYTHNGVVGLRFQSLTHAGQARLVVVVFDTGAGMTREALASYMQPFVKSSDSPGMGLGLALVRSLADELGATLRIKSRPGRGTVARLVLPLKHAVAAERVDTDKDQVGFVGEAARQDTRSHATALSLSPEDLATIQGYLLTGQVTLLETHLNDLRSKCKDRETLAWLGSAQHHLDMMNFQALGLLIEQLQRNPPDHRG